MPKAMLFVDGTWLYFNTPKLGKVYGRGEYHLDFGKLSKVLAGEVTQQSGIDEIDVVRSYLFGSYAANYDSRDNEMVQRRRDFFAMLKEEYHYEVEIYPVNFHGRRIRRQDRDPDDSFEPREKCVDISLATSMLYFAALPHAYDIAIAVLGDQDFTPVLQHVRRLGKRVAIASIRDSCAQELADPRDEARVKDYDVLWLDDLLEKLELKYERHQLQCEGPNHKGNRLVWTTFHPRKGQLFYCDVCREEFNRQRIEAQNQIVDVQLLPTNGVQVSEQAGVGTTAAGVVKKKFGDQRQYGFIHAADGDYFFHLTDLASGWNFDDVNEGMEVEFDIGKRPAGGRNGNAQNIRRRTT
jgi:uncharacterized LabA/DUF88 family protein/cold shock CspA family protein